MMHRGWIALVVIVLLGISGVLFSMLYLDMTEPFTSESWYNHQMKHHTSKEKPVAIIDMLDERSPTLSIFSPYISGIQNVDIVDHPLKKMFRLAMNLGAGGSPSHIHRYPQILLNTDGQDHDTVYYILYFAKLFSGKSFMRNSRKILMTFSTLEDPSLQAWKNMVGQKLITWDSTEIKTLQDPLKNGYIVEGSYHHDDQDESASKHIIQTLLHYIERSHIDTGCETMLYATSKARETELRLAYATDTTYHAHNTTSLLHSTVLKAMFPHMIIYRELSSSSPAYEHLLRFCLQFELIE